MRIALISDIHANIHALEAVLGDIKTQDCANYICLGDIVGYNAFPKECLHIIQQLECPTIKGNHDEEASRWCSSREFTPDAERAIDWTRKQLSEDDKKWLHELPYDQCIYNFSVVHATLNNPSGWNYIYKPLDAAACLANQATPICFIGHTHVPQAFIDGNNLLPQSFDKLQIEEEKKYIINVGSVGQPRDRNWRSAYCIYDTDRAEVTLRRVDYDVEAAQRAILNAGLPPYLAERLVLGK